MAESSLTQCGPIIFDFVFYHGVLLQGLSLGWWGVWGVWGLCGGGGGGGSSFPPTRIEVRCNT